MLKRQYKIGLACTRPGQEEGELFTNNRGTPAFEEFLEFLGQKVALNGFSNFSGGLDTTGGSTGTHSVFAHYHDNQIMFHVETLLPSQLHRKTLFSTDYVLLVFHEAGTPLDPAILTAGNYVLIVVSPVDSTLIGSNKTHYKVAVCCKEGVPPFGPSLPHPAIFEKSPAFNKLLLTKIINAERAVLCGYPAFTTKSTHLLTNGLQDIISIK